MSDAVYNYSAIRPAIRAMRTRRVDIAGIDDSNHALSGHGNDHGFQYALSLLVGLYASGLTSQNENYANGSGIGYFTTRIGVAATPILNPAVTATGTGSTTAGSRTITGSGTQFLSEISVGQVIKVGTRLGWVVSVESDTSLTVARAIDVTASGQTITIYAKAPNELHRHLDHGSTENAELFPHVYSYLASGSTFTGGTQNGFAISAGSPLDTAAALRGHLYYGTFDSGSGSIPLQWRLGVSPFSTISTLTVNTNTGTLGDMARADLDIAADASREGKGLEFRVQAGANMIGPAFYTFYRISRPDKAAGTAYHCLSYRGGESLRTQALSLQAAADATIDHLLSAMVDLQTGDPILIVRIAGGLNDRNETGTSVGPAAITDGDSPEAFADNTQAIINRISERWAALGYAATGLYFMLEPSHPVSSPDDPELVGYVEAAKGVADANPRTAVVDLRQLTSFEEMAACGWYAGTGDRNHRTQAGYEGIAVKIVQALLNTDSGADVGTLSDTALAQIIEAITGSEEIDTQQQANAQAALTAQGLTTERAAAIDTIESQTAAAQQQANVQAALTAQGATTARMATLPTTGTVSTLTAADVWEAGTRTITGGTVQATLGGDTVAAIAAALGSQANLNVYVPASGSTIDVYKGDAYSNDAGTGRRITITKAASETHWPTTLSTVHFTCTPTARTLEDHPDATGLEDVACTITTATGDGQSFYLELTDEQTATLTAGVGAYEFWFVANVSTAPATLRSGSMTARRGAAGATA